MERVHYEYRGFKATFWDLLRGDTSTWPDKPFYRAAILRAGQPALDVGSGTGRLLLDFLAEGIDIDGIDNSPEMLALCREKAQQRGLQPALFEQAMEELHLPRRYRTILVPSSSFQLVTDLSAAAEVMRRFFQHLEPGGTLVMPFMLLWTGPAPTSVEWRPNGEALRPEDGAIVRRWSRSTFDLVNQLEHTEDRYEVTRGGEVVASEVQARSPATHWYTDEQAIALYQAAGLADIRVVRGFTDEPATSSDKIFSVFGTRPRGATDQLAV